MVRKHATGLILMAALTLVACEGAEESPKVDRLQVVTDPHVACANGTDVALGDALRSEDVPTLTGDIDGDGGDDRVMISTDPEGPEGCRFFLIVEGLQHAYWAAIDSGQGTSSLENPTLSSLSDIDGEAGMEIVLNLEAGASTQFVGVMKLTRPGLERVTIDGRGPGPFGAEMEDLFPFGGSVGHLEAVDCAPEGLVVMSAALPVGAGADTYRVERRFFSPSHTALVLEKKLTERHTVEGLKVDDFPEFAGSPFLSCD